MCPLVSLKSCHSIAVLNVVSIFFYKISIFFLLWMFLPQEVPPRGSLASKKVSFLDYSVTTLLLISMSLIFSHGSVRPTHLFVCVSTCPGLKPYVCSLCSYAGRSRSNLKTHMNRHNSEKHHLCDLCGKKFKSKLTLKSHRQSHTDEGTKNYAQYS